MSSKDLPVYVYPTDLLKDKGELYMVHRPDRLVDILSLMRKNKIEPKILRMVVLPAPEAPKIIQNSPCSILNVTPSAALIVTSPIL